MKFCVMLVVLFSVALCEDTELFEGDIVLDRGTLDIMSGTDGSVFDAMTSRKWPNGVIPYIFDAQFSRGNRKSVQQAIDEYSKFTCIQFVPRTYERNYIRFVERRGCHSHIGMTGGGSQDVSIGKGCEAKGTIMHEMMHAVGFFHEQSRRDRDKHITVNWNNIEPGMEYNFRKYYHGEADTLGEPYDLDSVMHYGKYSFSKNRYPTIVVKSVPEHMVGQRYGFSKTDIRQLNKMYGCPDVESKISGCKDVSIDCPEYARKGYCKNPWSSDYMKGQCCDSCTGCQDVNENCASYVKEYMCNMPMYKEYMKRNCCRSCSRTF